MVRQSREKERGGGQPLLAVNTHQPVLGIHDSDRNSDRNGDSDSDYLRQLKPTNSNRMKLIAVGLFYLSNNYNNNDISHHVI